MRYSEEYWLDRDGKRHYKYASHMADEERRARFEARRQRRVWYMVTLCTLAGTAVVYEFIFKLLIG